ncbi:MAG: beta-galactosidase, partial [Armatimonadota bacterium]
ISAKTSAISTVSVPIDVNSDKLAIKFNPTGKENVVKNGKREPVIFSQMMVDMRSQVHLGPFPEKHIIDRMKEMQSCGINVVCTTSMPWLYDLYQFKDWNYHGESWKYALDVVRKLGMQVEGWGAYSYDRGTIEGIANWVSGKDIKLHHIFNSQYYGVDNADPLLSWANAVTWLYQFHRWGDLFYKSDDGAVPFSSEDTRGWMRQDFNIRYKMGDSTIKAFQNWIKNKYGQIASVNAAWKSDYKSFDEINPEAGQNKGPFGHEFEYTNPKHTFHDWNAAVEDLDIFRTELRVKNYRETLAIVRREIPGATIAIRTEGANVLVQGIDPETTNPHLRHIYYSQRRCGLIADIIQKSGLVKVHSDYTTIPYTPTELRQLTRMSVKQGITPVYLAQFDNMRDIAINKKYGTEYQIHYNLPEPRKGAMMHCLTAVYPWMKVTYEEGGVPAILWEDYCCDGFVTETQKREMRFFMGKLRDALNTPDAVNVRTVKPGQQPSQSWRKRSKAIPSFDVNPDLLR